MPIKLKPEQEAWLQAHVANGEFSSIEEAAIQLIDDRTADLAIDDDDMPGPNLMWTRPAKPSNTAT